MPVIAQLGAFGAEEAIHTDRAGCFAPATVVLMWANLETIIGCIDFVAGWDWRAILRTFERVIVSRACITGDQSFVCVGASRALDGYGRRGVGAVVSLGARLADEVQRLTVVAWLALHVGIRCRCHICATQ